MPAFRAQSLNDKEVFPIDVVFTELVRWAFVALALYILLRSIVSLLRNKSYAEVWAYLHLETLKPLKDDQLEMTEISVPLTHWENVIGRTGNCDIVIKDKAVSRNHGILMRDGSGNWTYRDVGSKNGSFLNNHQITEPMKPVPVNYGDEICMGATTCTLLPISLEEKNNNIHMRRCDTQNMSAGPTFAALTLFQLLAAFQLALTVPSETLPQVILAFGGLILVMWVYLGVMRTMKQTAFEMDTIAFFLSTLSLAVVASSNPDALKKQLIAVALGVCAMVIICMMLRNLELTKKMRWVLLFGAVGLLVFNLTFGSFIFGAKNWIQIGPVSFQPSELVKVAFIWIGAATLDELFQKKNLWTFMFFSGFCFCCLAIMGDFGTAIIFFVTFVVISFLRSGDFSKLFLFLGAAFAGGMLIIRFKPYIANRFASWGHVWESEFVDAAGYQQSRAMSAAASGGLVGVGAGEGWLESVPAADTDMVFCMLTEEWGLIIALLAVLCIVTLAVFSVRSIMEGRSTFYTIAACGAMSMFVFQTMLNVFGSVDLFPFTGVTFPFVSNGGTSMMVSWALLAFLKSADTRERASIAVKAGERL
ncbi:MAG: FtsW/RodA/SpoVE family cell cycle protein [Firmicutes bacterium]|nr:FtsW/RodA/SpoVE family cell cycle protein [Bacillota bacterium]